MTDLSYMIWFIATGAMTITVLAVGTLAAAELLPRRRRVRRRTRFWNDLRERSGIRVAAGL